MHDEQTHIADEVKSSKYADADRFLELHDLMLGIELTPFDERTEEEINDYKKWDEELSQLRLEMNTRTNSVHTRKGFLYGGDGFGCFDRVR